MPFSLLQQQDTKFRAPDHEGHKQHKMRYRKLLQVFDILYCEGHKQYYWVCIVVNVQEVVAGLWHTWTFLAHGKIGVFGLRLRLSQAEVWE